MKGMKKLNFCMLSILIATTAVSAQADIFTLRSAKHGGAYVSLEGFRGDGTDTFISNFPFARVVSFDQASPTLFYNERVLQFDPDSEWGYRIAIGYDFCSCCPCNYGFSLEYTHFDSDDHQRAEIARSTVSTITQAIVPFNTFLPALTNNIFSAVTAQFDTRYDTVDLLGHQNRVLCNCVEAQFFIGARYLRFREELDQHFFESSPGTTADPLNSDLTAHFSNRFTGIGPRVGVAAFYPLVKGFGISTEVAGNLLFGCTRSQYSEDLSSNAVTIVFTDEETFRNDPHDRAKFVPGWSGKVSLAYHADFCNRSSLTVEVGYRGDKYYEVSDVRAIVGLPLTSFNAIKNEIYHDFEITGPYASISYHM